MTINNKKKHKIIWKKQKKYDQLKLGMKMNKQIEKLILIKKRINYHVFSWIFATKTIIIQ